MSDSSVTPWTTARQAARSMGLPRQEHRNGLPFPFPEDLPDPGIEPSSPATFSELQADSLPLSHLGNSKYDSFTRSLQWLKKIIHLNNAEYPTRNFIQKKKSMFMISSAIITKYNCYIWNRFPDFRNLPTCYSFYFCSIPIFLACKKRCQKSCLDILKYIFTF